jgi:hypothetical protein
MACDHLPIKSDGQIVCRHCRAIWRIDMDGCRWSEPVRKKRHEQHSDS